MTSRSAWRNLVASAVAAFIGCVLLGLAIPAIAASPDQAPPIAAGQARVWFLRQLLSDEWDAPMIYANGAPLAISLENTAFYRDFAPGPYVFDVQNCLPQAGAAFAVTLTPGDQIALEVQSDEDDSDAACELGPTSYLRPPAAQDLADIFASLRYLGKNQAQ
jgi:hypothetical protein